jgi:putative DNA primase/helicase
MAGSGPQASIFHGIEEKTVRGETTIRLIDRWISSVMRVKAITRTAAGKEHSYLLEFVSHDGNVLQRQVLPQSQLVGHITDLMQFLRPLGISVLFENREYIRDYLDHEHQKFSAEHPEHFLEAVKGVGWHRPGKTFILPTEIIGDKTRVWFNGQNVACFGAGGTLATWKTEVATPCEGNSYLVVGLSTAFAGPLLEPLNIAGLGIHLYGVSTTGKSTVLDVGGSAWGITQGIPRFTLSWHNTINGLEAAATDRSSTLIVLDESHQVDPKVLDAAVYMLLNRIGKGRMHRDTSAREVAGWYPCVLSSGERSIESHQTGGGIEHKVGQTVRVIDLLVVDKGKNGLFADLHDKKTGEEFSQKLRDSAAKHYGHAGPLFVQHLIKNYASLSLRERFDAIVEQFPKNLNAQDARVARSFALAALAGELAIEWDIVPWPKNSALIAAVEIFNHWLSGQPQSVRNKESAQLLKGVKDFIETRGADFSDADWVAQFDLKGRITNPQPVIHERAGYWKEENGKRVYCFLAAGLQRASGSFGATKAGEVLDEVGALFKKEKSRYTHNVWVAELQCNKRCYWVDPEKLTEF